MILYVLTLEIGISSGCNHFLGIYDSVEKAEEMREKHLRKYGCVRDHYIVSEVGLNEEVDIVFAEW